MLSPFIKKRLAMVAISDVIGRSDLSIKNIKILFEWFRNLQQARCAPRLRFCEHMMTQAVKGAGTYAHKASACPTHINVLLIKGSAGWSRGESQPHLGRPK